MIIFFLSFFSSSENPETQKIEQLISKKQFRGALTLVESEIKKQGQLDADAVLFFYRGQCLFENSKFEQALTDLTKFISSSSPKKDDLNKAQCLKSKCHLKLGNLDEAELTASFCDQLHRNELKSAQAFLKKIKSTTNLTQALQFYDSLLVLSPSSVSYLVDVSRIALELDLEDNFSEYSVRAMQIASKNSQLLSLRGQFYLCKNDLIMAKKHFQSCVSSASNPKDCTTFLKSTTKLIDEFKQAKDLTSKKLYGPAQTSIDEAEIIGKSCCKPDSVLNFEVMSLKANLLLAKGQDKEALKYLNTLLEQNPNIENLRLDRADIHLKNGDLESANDDYQYVYKKNKKSERSKKGIEKVSKLRDEEKKVDYYETLGVKKGCSMNEIKQAYRKLAREWHPDRHNDPVKKKEAERKMKRINLAFDVLGDPEKKKLVDQGIDPENPQQGFPGGEGFQGGFPGGFHFPGGFGGFQGGGGGGGQRIKINFGGHNVDPRKFFMNMGGGGGGGPFGF